MSKNLKQIIGLILQQAEKEKHPDRVSCIHAVFMQVSLLVGEEMLKIRLTETGLKKP